MTKLLGKKKLKKKIIINFFFWRREKVTKIRGEIIKNKKEKRKEKGISIFEVHRWHNRKK